MRRNQVVDFTFALIITLSIAGCGEDIAAPAGEDSSVDAAADPAVDPATARFAPPDLGDWTGELVPPPPAQLPPVLADFEGTHASGLSCGPHEQNLVDIFVPANTDAPPLLLYIHGGGFTGGTRLAVLQESVPEQYLELGFAFATMDYRRLQDGRGGVQTSLQDIQVCLQFLRMHAGTIGFDPERIVLAGGSAGAGASLWIATHDDLAEQDHAHPVLQQSTEVLAIVITGSQSTYDILAWKDVFLPEYPDAFDAVNRDELLEFYDVESENELEEEPYLSYRAAAHMLAKFDSSDPPIWLESNGLAGNPAEGFDHLHHPFHARAIIHAAEEAGLEIIATVSALDEVASESGFEFAARHARLE